MSATGATFDVGTYGEPGSLMPDSVALTTVDFFYRIYGAIKHIQFFGGEPLLNGGVLDLVCRHVTERHEAAEIPSLPTFSVVTNGTILSPKVVDTLASFRVKVTVSLDGPERVHDHLRGAGTFARIVRNVEALQRRGIEVGVECTLTGYHLALGFDVVALMEFFYNEFGMHVSHIPFVSTLDCSLAVRPDDLKASYARAIRLGASSLSTDDYKLESFGFRLLRALVYRRKTELYCPAGVTTLAVSSTGDIYPCFIFVGHEDLLVGSAVRGQVYRKQLDSVSSLLKKANSRNDPGCQNCWARWLCFGCLGHSYIVSGLLDHRIQCDFNRHISEVGLLAGSHILNNPLAVQRIMSLSESIPS
jgi:uncharacterized protein